MLLLIKLAPMPVPAPFPDFAAEEGVGVAAADEERSLRVSMMSRSSRQLSRLSKTSQIRGLCSFMATKCRARRTTLY